MRLVKYENVLQDSAGNVVAEALCTVTVAGSSTPVTLYSDQAGASPIVGNVITTDARGTFKFYAAQGRIDIAFAKGGVSLGSILDAHLVKPASQYLVIDLVADYGASGTNGSGGTAALDTAALTAAINFSNSVTFPVCIQVPPGFYVCTAAMPAVTKPLKIKGTNKRGAIFFPQGNFNFLTFGTGSSRVPDCEIEDILIDASGMTGGWAVVADWTQRFAIRNSHIANPYNGISIRQSGNTKIHSDIDTARGLHGVLVYGTGASRNGETDKCDVIDFGADRTITGNYIPGGDTPTVDLVTLDGYAHTVTGGALRLLAGRRGFVAKNTPALAQKFGPSFVLLREIEVENTWEESVRLEHINVFKAGVFSATSVSESGVYLGAAANRIKLPAGDVTNHWKHGVLIDGAQDVTISSVDAFRNGGAGPGVYSGVHIVSGDNITVIGGLLGKPAFDTGGAYTENQHYGINNVGGTNVTAMVVDARNNYTGGINGSVVVKNCLGYAAPAPAAVTVTASPFTYTNGAAETTLYISGGTVSDISVGGASLFSSTDKSVTLKPGQACVITYSSAPTVKAAS
jgi:hypothetical protein